MLYCLQTISADIEPKEDDWKNILNDIDTLVSTKERLETDHQALDQVVEDNASVEEGVSHIIEELASWCTRLRPQSSSTLN